MAVSEGYAPFLIAFCLFVAQLFVCYPLFIMTSKPLLTLYTITLTLAYIQYYTIPFLPGRCFPALHLRRLARWIGQPDDTIRTIKTHKGLATHLVLLQAAGLLSHDDQFWVCQPIIFNWLQHTSACKITILSDAIRQCRWTAVATQMKLPDLLCPAHVAYVEQTLARQLTQSARQTNTSVKWLPSANEQWQLLLPTTLPLALHFHLRQFGEWMPQKPLQITPLTIAQAKQSGYNLYFIESTLIRATGQSMTQEQQTKLIDWYQRSETYQIQAAYLLTVKQPEQMAAIINNTRLRHRVHTQLSPRHATVSPEIISPLQKWLQKQQYPLNKPQMNLATQDFSPTTWHWFGIQLMAALGQLLPLPAFIPKTTQNNMPAIPVEQQAELDYLISIILKNLREAIRGRDAFFPSRKSIPPEWLQTVRHAINAEETLKIMYQPLGDVKPSHRRIQPLRLEERDTLFYIVAYCFRAEMNLTFRMDRIASIGRKQ